MKFLKIMYLKLHEQKCVLIEHQSHIRHMAHTNCTLQKNKKDIHHHKLIEDW